MLCSSMRRGWEKTDRGKFGMQCHPLLLDEASTDKLLFYSIMIGTAHCLVTNLHLIVGKQNIFSQAQHLDLRCICLSNVFFLYCPSHIICMHIALRLNAHDRIARKLIQGTVDNMTMPYWGNEVCTLNHTSLSR